MRLLPRKCKRSEASNKIPIIQRNLTGRLAINNNCIAVTGLVCHEFLGDLRLNLLVPRGSEGGPAAGPGLLSPIPVCPHGL